MISLSDVAITAQIYESPNSVVYRGTRNQDNRAVILKVLKQDYPTPAELVRYKQEYEITHSLNIEGVIKAYALQEYQRTLVIILEDFGAESLQKLIWGQGGNLPMPLPEFLRLAIKLAEILGCLHAANIIHKDINPSNIVLNPKTGQVKIIDFGIATRLTRTNPTLSHPNVLEGTLAYMSPEQTGRMNRFLDYRTDFYSLGVTFYELITGQRPFTTTDVLELVHCHIAKQPIPPHILTVEVPKPVSDMIMKLMAKTAEERYQSAWGIVADLEACLRQLETTGKIEEFAIGSQDISDKFQIPQKLYGREQEIATLLAAFNRVAGEEEGAGEQGRWGDGEDGEEITSTSLSSTSSSLPASPPLPISASSFPPCPNSRNELMLVAGYSGIGKSALVAEIYKPITKRKGYFISGKFDQFQRNIPYSAVVNAFAGLVRQILTESQERLNQWRAKILSALGANSQVIIDVIPEVELIVGKQPPLPELGPTEAQNRFNLVFQNFIRVFCSPEHPLAIFLDDLQWADTATLKLIKLIMTEGKTQYLFTLGAYRDNEVNANHPLMITLDELRQQGAIINQITLAPLAINCVRQIIAETLHSDVETVKPLANLIFRKTGGNPFFVNEFLKTLYAENLIAFNPNISGQRWKWNLARIEAIGFTDNVVDLMISKLNKLPKSTQNMLRIAACVGGEFDSNTLSLISQKPLKKIDKILFNAVQLGLIVPTANLDEQLLIESYKFGHDRIQQAAYALIKDKDKKALQLQIGRLLLQNISTESLSEEIFKIVDHFNLGVELVTEVEERHKIAELNLISGKKAKAATAYESAVIYLSLGREILAENSWETEYELTLNLYVEAVESEYLNTNYSQAKILSNLVLKQAKKVIEKVQVYEIIILLYSAQNQLQPAIETGLEALEMLGVSLSLSQPQTLSMEELYNLPEMTDSYKQAAMRILMMLFAPSYSSNPGLLLQISFTMVELCINYGNSPLAAYAYALYGLLLCGVLEDIDLGYQFGKLSLRVLDKFDAKEIKCRVYNKFNSFIIHWKEAARKSLEPLRETVQIGLETGDIEFACYASLNYCINLLLVGEPLEYVDNQNRQSCSFMQNLKQDLPLDVNQLWAEFVVDFIDKKPDPNLGVTEKKLTRMVENNTISFLYTFYLLKSILSYFFKDTAQAVAIASEAEKYQAGLSGLLPITQMPFYSSLALLSHYPNVSSEEKIEYLQKVAANQEKLKKWAEHAPMNFQHKYDLVAAEKARILGENWSAAELYERAIKGAKENGYLHEEALAYELAAEFYLARGMDKIAQTYMTEARYGYVRWQAKSKVKDLEERYPQFLAQKSLRLDQNTTTSSSNSTASSVLDLNSVLKASQALGSEIVLGNLLAKMMKIAIENAGAQTGYLILQQRGEARNENRQWVIEASGTIESEQVQVLQSIPMGDSILSTAIVNYVIRTQKSLVLDDAAKIDGFAEDPYIVERQPKSILCAPLLNQGHLVGILYLENNLTTGAFTPQRLEVLNLLSSQAAISIQNAKLYAQLRESESKLTQFLEAVPVGIAVFSPNGQISYMNQTGQDIVGQGARSEATREELASTYQLYIAGTDQIYPSEQMPAMLALKGETVRIDDMEVHRDGKIIPLEVISTPVFDEKGNIIYSINAFADITERKQAEKLLADYNRILQKQVQERTLELQREIEERKRAEKAALAASEAKSTFLANMSHELRSPLNAILGFAELMSRSQDIPPEQQDSLSIITRSGQHLLALINQVLDLSKIEAGRITLNEVNFDLHSLLLDLENMYQLKAQEKELQLVFNKTPEVPQYIRTDEVKLRQVLINLVSNAIKFTSSGGVSVRVALVNAPPATVAPTQGEGSEDITNYQLPITNYRLQFEVEDTGCGIAASELETLFEAFVQTTAGKESQEGTGLGLTISRKFVEMMGGEMTVSSQVGKGSIFKFEIEAIAIASASMERLPITRSAIALAANQPEYRILIVDDNGVNRKLLFKMLSPFGFKLQQASNGLEAIEIWQVFQPQLIFMDMRMPTLSGIEATKRIKATAKGKETAIVALTASSLEEERAAILAAGCDDFIRKPFLTTDILDALHRHIGVEYVYDQPAASIGSTATSSDILSLSAIAALPADLIADFRQAIIDLDVEMIQTHIDRIQTHDRSLADALAALAKNFQFEQILALINPETEET
ncbi:MAG TPA: PAS sensor protein [Cyanobacteria bacterium UBA11372]|nr:PAS sensor protein [Cyanobacteria bacterium UBA11372]